MSALNLLHDGWLPVVTRAGRRRIIRAADLTLDLDHDPITDVDWPRADLRVATLEWLIGLLTTACLPDGDGAWRRWWDHPPSPDELADRLAPYRTAFNFDGDGPRFLQESGDLGQESNPVAGLLIDQPGANTEKNNADLFVKRGQITVLARSTAAMALYALQAFAPSGGAGHRTGLRGGGPLTSLALPPAEASAQDTLWHRVWLNVTGHYDPIEDGEPLDDPARAFPWLGAPRLSDKSGVVTTGADLHPVQCFWGMPRRIALIFEANSQGLPCDLTGAVEEVIVRAYRTRPYGVNYTAVDHPLTPSYRVKATGSEWLPVHPQPGGIAYRHWLGFVVEPQANSLRRPARCITMARWRLRRDARLTLVGYDMDNMKARGFVETEMPLLSASSEQKRHSLDRLAERLVNGASEVAGLLLSQIKAAKGPQASGLDLIRESFFTQSETAFFDQLAAGRQVIEAVSEEEEHPDLLVGPALAWLHQTLAPLAMHIFNRHVSPEAVVMTADPAAIKRMVKAQQILSAGLKGYGPAGRSLMTVLTGADGAPPRQKSRKGAVK